MNCIFSASFHLQVLDVSITMATPAQACGLAFLPSELLKLIFDHLKPKSLLQVRLSCKALSSHSTPGAFERITVWLEEGRLSDIAKIAEQPHLAPYVRQISCGMEEFNNLSLDDFNVNFYSDWTIGESERAKMEDLEDSWQIYNSYAVLQRNLDSSGRGHTMLCECFKSFRNLKSLEIHGGGSNWHDPEHGLRLLRKEPRLRHQMLLFYQPSLGLSRGKRQLSTMLKALAHANKHIEHLGLHPFDFEMDSRGLLAPLMPREEKLALAAFVGLTSLDLDLYNLIDGRSARSTTQDSSLSTIFRAAVDLTSLRIKVRSLSLLSTWSGLSRATSGSRHLETLVIEGATLDQTEFVEFMRESCQNLRSLTIHRASVSHGSSTAIFDAIRSLPKLERVKFFQLFWKSPEQSPIAFSGKSIGGRIDDVDAQPLYDYILRKSNVYPEDVYTLALGRELEEV